MPENATVRSTLYCLATEEEASEFYYDVDAINARFSNTRFVFVR